MKRILFSLLTLCAITSMSLMSCTGDKPQSTDNEANTSEETPTPPKPTFELSLAQWSLHKALNDKELDHLDFAKTAAEMGFTGVEYVATFFKDKAEDAAYLEEMNKRAKAHGVKQLLIMVDGEGKLSSPDQAERDSAVLKHQKWVNAASTLGCHSIRVNLFGENDQALADWATASVDGLSRLAKYAKTKGINVLVENHGWQSSNAAWLMTVMKEIDMENCGTLPDFGNFCTRREGPGAWEGDCLEKYDAYQGVEEMMPKAIAVSAKSYKFDESGAETTIDYKKMLDIVKDAGYEGFIGVEYEGDELSEKEGIMATKALLEKTM